MSLKPTLIVGLGGTGVKILRKLKKQFLDVKQWQILIPPIIRFIAFD